MEISNLELEELRGGLGRLRSHKAEPLDPEPKKLACVILADRVGHALRRIRDACDSLDEATATLADTHAMRDRDGKAIAVIGQGGEAIGIQIGDVSAFNRGRRSLLKERKTIPGLSAITYDLLLQAGVPIDGELVQGLGDFLIGEPPAIEGVGSPAVVAVGGAK